MKALLKFSNGNKKLAGNVATFSIPAGHTCPGARDCLSRAHRITGKIQDGPATRFRCFSASQEAAMPSVRRARWYNFDLLTKTADTARALSQPLDVELSDLIRSSLAAHLQQHPETEFVRIHVAGDFYSVAYLMAWFHVANAFPKLTFYAYSKSLLYIDAARQTMQQPLNLRLVASMGGRADAMALTLDLPRALVMHSEHEAELAGLPVDHDDSHAQRGDTDFALLIHGTQPAGSAAAQALQALRAAKKAQEVAHV